MSLYCDSTMTHILFHPRLPLCAGRIRNQPVIRKSACHWAPPLLCCSLFGNLIELKNVKLVSEKLWQFRNPHVWLLLIFCYTAIYLMARNISCWDEKDHNQLSETNIIWSLFWIHMVLRPLFISFYTPTHSSCHLHPAFSFFFSQLLWINETSKCNKLELISNPCGQLYIESA